MQWFIEHLDEIGAALASLLALASVITGLTPTPKDDDVLRKIREVLHRIGILRHSDEPGTIKPPGASRKDSE